MSESGLEKEIIVDINPYQTRVVLLEQGTPEDIFGNPQHPRLKDFLSKVL